MRFPIDVVGLDANLRIVRLWPRVKPCRVTSVSLKVHSVLELADGEIAARALRLNDQLVITRNLPSTQTPGLSANSPAGQSAYACTIS